MLPTHLTAEQRRRAERIARFEEIYDRAVANGRDDIAAAASDRIAAELCGKYQEIFDR